MHLPSARIRNNNYSATGGESGTYLHCVRLFLATLYADQLQWIILHRWSDIPSAALKQIKTQRYYHPYSLKWKAEGFCGMFFHEIGAFL